MFSFLGLKPTLASKVSIVLQTFHGTHEMLRLNFFLVEGTLCVWMHYCSDPDLVHINFMLMK